jgi:hypothetical protein
LKILSFLFFFTEYHKNWGKNKKYYTVAKSNRKIVERGKQMHARSLSWLCTGTSIKSGGVKQVLSLLLLELSHSM